MSFRIDSGLKFIHGDNRPPDIKPLSADSLSADFGQGNRVETWVDRSLSTGNLHSFVRKWTVVPGCQPCRLTFAVSAPIRARHWCVPSVMYDGNLDGQGEFPKGGPETGWSFREDRSALAAASFVWDEEQCLGLWAEAATTESQVGSTCTQATEDSVTLVFQWPAVEEPVTYTGKYRCLHAKSQATRPWFRPSNALTIERRFFVWLGPEPDGMNQAIRAWWTLIPKADASSHPWSDILSRKLFHVRSNLTRTLGNHIGLITAVSPSGWPLLNSCSAGFLGRNVETAWATGEAGMMAGSTGLTEFANQLALGFTQSPLSNGLFKTDYQFGRKRWCGLSYRPRAGLSTRIMAEAAVQGLKIASSDWAFPKVRDAWRSQALGLAAFFATRLPHDGNPGRFWSQEGVRTDSRGTNGAYALQLLVRAASLTQDQQLREAAFKCGDWCMELAHNGRFSGDTLDADCIDKEAGHSVLKALIDLHDLTGSESCLLAARKAAAFLDTWVFGYRVPFGPETPLGKRDFSTIGATSVSVAHHHLDPYGLAIGFDYLRLWQKTGEEHFRALALHMIAYCAQLVAGPSDNLGRPDRYFGYQPEQVQHTRWAYWSLSLTPRGSFYSDIAWVPGLTMGAIVDIAESYPDLITLAPCDLAPAPLPRSIRARRCLFGLINRFA